MLCASEQQERPPPSPCFLRGVALTDEWDGDLARLPSEYER